MPLSEPEGDLPVRANSDSPRTLTISFQRMQAKGRLVHILNPFRGVERREDQPQPVELISLELPPLVVLEQELQAFMPETLNHLFDCKTSIDICQQQRTIADSYRPLYKFAYERQRIYSFCNLGLEYWRKKPCFTRECFSCDYRESRSCYEGMDSAVDVSCPATPLLPDTHIARPGRVWPPHAGRPSASARLLSGGHLCQRLGANLFPRCRRQCSLWALQSVQ